jgi:hypothetical protein
LPKPASPRLHRLLAREVSDPRMVRGKRHKLQQFPRAVVAGLLVNWKSLRDLEDLSAQFGLGRLGEAVSATGMGHVLEKVNRSELVEVLVQEVYDMNHRAELGPDGLPVRIATLDIE